VGQDELEPAGHVRAGVTQVAGDQARGEVRAEHRDVPLPAQRVTGADDGAAQPGQRLGGHAPAEGGDE